MYFFLMSVLLLLSTDNKKNIKKYKQAATHKTDNGKYSGGGFFVFVLNI